MPGAFAGRQFRSFVVPMSLQPLLDIAHQDGRLRSLGTAARDAAQGGGSAVDAHMSAGVRPYLLAALLEADYALAGRPALIVAADDRSARDLAGELRAYLGSRRVRYYPSRGTGYESHVAPPPHLVGLRIAALDALTTEVDAPDAPRPSPRSRAPPRPR